MAPIRTVSYLLCPYIAKIDPSTQQWTRLIRFVAAETAQVHVGQPIDPNLDGM
jgi:hypothetical protein